VTTSTKLTWQGLLGSRMDGYPNLLALVSTFT
jgi:hypothetical protein